jgi:hypothetical protein
LSQCMVFRGRRGSGNVFKMDSRPRPAEGAETPKAGRGESAYHLPQPEDPAERGDIVWRELERSFHFYDRHASRNRLGYQSLKVITLVMGACVTVLAARGASATLTAVLAAGVVVLEGIQQVFQLHTNWITYRATAETLRNHAFRYTAGAEPYTDPRQRRRRLAENLQSVTANENSAWANYMTSSATRGPTGQAPT